MAIAYPATLPCPIAGDYSPGDTFIRSQFDFDVRERPICTRQYEAKYTFLIESAAQMAAFREFYYTTTLRGTLPFTADWRVEDNIADKDFRFAAVYKPVFIGNDNYEVIAVFDVMTLIETL